MIDRGPASEPARSASGLDHVVLAAHLASGAIWITGLRVASRDLGAVLLTGLAAYAVLGSLALARRGSRHGRVLVAGWVVAVVLVTALVVPGAGWLSPVLGAVIGTTAFGAWSLTGALLTRFVTGGRALDPSPHDGHQVLTPG